MIHYRAATNKDLTHLRDIDLKCHEQMVSTHSWWSEIEQNPESGCVVVCKTHVPVGMIVWERQAFKLPNFDSKQTTLHIHKLCVRKEFRNNKCGQKLLGYGYEEAVRLECPYMSISVPEYRCGKSAEHGDLGAWLNKQGFNATIILPTKIQMYGQDFDQFLFVYEVK